MASRGRSSWLGRIVESIPLSGDFGRARRAHERATGTHVSWLDKLTNPQARGARQEELREHREDVLRHLRGDTAGTASTSPRIQDPWAPISYGHIDAKTGVLSYDAKDALGLRATREATEDQGWSRKRDIDDAYERSLQRQQELTREEAAERRRDTAAAAKAARLTRDHDRPAVWVNPGRAVQNRVNAPSTRETREAVEAAHDALAVRDDSWWQQQGRTVDRSHGFERGM